MASGGQKRPLQEEKSDMLDGDSDDDTNLDLLSQRTFTSCRVVDPETNHELCVLSPITGDTTDTTQVQETGTISTSTSTSGDVIYSRTDTPDGNLPDAHLQVTNNKTIKNTTIHIEKLDSLVLGGQVNVAPADEKEAQETSEIAGNNRRKPRSQTEKHIEGTTGMVVTEAVQAVKASISEGNTWVTITGGPGDGKKSAAYLVMKELYEMGKDIHIIHTPEMYFSLKGVTNAVLMFKDILGQPLFRYESWERWRPVFTDLRETTEAHSSDRGKLNVIILVERLHVLKSASGYIGESMEMIKENIIDVSKLSRSEEEKLSIWRYHAEKYKIDINNQMVQQLCKQSKIVPFGFPYCCQKFAKLWLKYKKREMITFFMKPLEFLKESLTPLLNDETVKSVLKQILRNNRQDNLVSFDDEAHRCMSYLEDTYINVTKDNQVTFSHESICDTVAFILASSELPQDVVFAIKYCPVGFLKERIIFKKIGSECKLMAYLKATDKVIGTFIERSVDEIINNRNMEDVLSHSVWEEIKYTSTFMQKLTAKTDLSELVQYEDNRFGRSFLYLSVCGNSPNILEYISNHMNLTSDEQTEVVCAVFENDGTRVLQFFLGEYPDFDWKTVIEGMSSKMAFDRCLNCLDLLHKRDIWSHDVFKLFFGGKSLLHLCCEKGVSTEIIRSLIQQGADVNLQCSQSMTPLHYACQQGSEETVAALIDANADVNMRSRTGTPFHCAIECGNIRIIQMLTDKGVEVKEYETEVCLAMACHGGNINVWKTLLAVFKPKKLSPRLLEIAVEANDLRMVKELVNLGVNVNESNLNYDGHLIPLLKACREGKDEITKFLIESGGNVNLKDAFGSILWDRSHKGLRVDHLWPVDCSYCPYSFQMPPADDRMVILIEGGLDVNVTSEYGGDMPLHYACFWGLEKSVKALLERGADVNVTNTDGLSSLHTACTQQKSSHKIVKLLVEKNADVNKMCNEYRGVSPLHLACRKGLTKVIKILLDAHADVNQLDKAHNSCLYYLCTHPESPEIFDVVKQFIERGADKDALCSGNRQALHGWYRAQYTKQCYQEKSGRKQLT